MSARVLIACEFSGTVRRAFTAAGFDAWSCDILPAEDGSNHHITGNVLDVLGEGWDLLIVAHPPCTRLCNSGVRWLTEPPPGRTSADMWRELDEGAALFTALWQAPVPRVAVENPVMHRHAKERIGGYVKPAQSVQPWQYGEWEKKRTCLWLRGLPALVPTFRTIEDARTALQETGEPKARVHRMSPGKHRARERSRFFPGIAGRNGRAVGTHSDTRAGGAGRMTLPKIPDHQISAAMERLVRDGRAEWTTTRGKPALRLTAFGRAMLRHAQTAEAVQ